MTGFSEYPEAAEFIFTQLTDPPIDGFEGLVEEHPGSEGSPWPRITFQETAWDDVTEVAENRVWSELLFLVTGGSKGASTKALKALATAIDARLHRVSGTTTDGQVISCVRRGGFQLGEQDAGVNYRRLGGYYSVLVQPTNP